MLQVPDRYINQKKSCEPSFFPGLIKASDHLCLSCIHVDPLPRLDVLAHESTGTNYLKENPSETAWAFEPAHTFRGLHKLVCIFLRAWGSK